MHCIDRVLQRVRHLREGAADAALKPLSASVGAVMGVIGLALQAKTVAQGVGLYVEEIAKRAFKCHRATQEALKKAECLGLIRRVRQPGSKVGDQLPWRIFVHPLVIAEAYKKDAHRGDILVFPRAWDDLSKGLQAAVPLASSTSMNADDRAVPKSVPAANGQRKRAAIASGRASTPALPIVALDIIEIERALVTYFAWVIGASLCAGHEPNFQVLGQRRKRDGERGGTFIPCGLAAEIPASEVVQSATAAVQWSANERVELTYRLGGEAHPLLLLDDVTAEALTRLPWPGAVIESSPGNFQVTLIADRSLSPQERLLAQRGLQRHANADKAAVSSAQLRRMPGSINGKRELDRVFVARLHSVPTAAPATGLGSLVDSFIAAGRDRGGTEKTSDRKSNKQVDGVQDAGVSKDQSAADFGWLMHQLTRKVQRAEDVLVAELAAKAGARSRHGQPREHLEHLAYAKKTLRACLKRLDRI